MPGTKLDSEQRLALVIETQRVLSAAGDDVRELARLVACRATEITGADGAMVNLIEGDMLRTVGASGSAQPALGDVRPIATSVARFAIESGAPVLSGDTATDERINPKMRSWLRHTSMICAPLLRGDTVIGTLNVLHCDQEERLGEEDRRTLEMLSVVLSSGVSRVAEIVARQAQTEAIARFRTLFDGASIGIVRLDALGLAVEVNPALGEMLGMDAMRMIGSRFVDLLVEEDREAVSSLVGEMLASGGAPFSLDARAMRGEGRPFWVHLRAVAELGADGTPSGVMAMIEDISERKRAEEELVEQCHLNEHQALHDPLTGLPNRLLFGERIGQAIRQAQRNGKALAVAIMDLDRFKEVNDSLGHMAGDQLLRAVAERVAASVRASDTVARLGGDEFGLLVPDLADESALLRVIERIRSSLERPVYVQSLPVAVEASIGIAIFPDNGADPAILIQRADVAMYESKRSTAEFSFYDERSHELDLGRLTLVAELRRALADRELTLYYQPKAALATGQISSVEALLRWQHPERGLVYPDAFIPIAQETGLIGPLSLYVIEEALRQGRLWLEQGLELMIAVNLSTRNLLDSEFPRRVAELLERSGMSASSLELEVTESAMLANPTRAKMVMSELSELGIRLSIDDFGTGFSSLAYLRQLPVDEIKIDRSFVLGMSNGGDDDAIVRSTIDLGRNLGLDVVAEGVETQADWNRLRTLGCQIAQGYYLSRPVPPAELSSWLRARTTLAA